VNIHGPEKRKEFLEEIEEIKKIKPEIKIIY